MHEFTNFDQNIGFHVTNYVYIQILRSIGLNLGQNVSKTISIFFPGN